MRRKRSRFFSEAKGDQPIVQTLLPAYEFVHFTFYADPNDPGPSHIGEGAHFGEL
jgi:hypothetical protein